MAGSALNGRVPPAAGAPPEDLRLALRAATLYYLDGLTQAEVAARLGVSRPTAGRLVARAKARGLVRIEVAVPDDQRDALHADEEYALERAFGLTEAVVVGDNVDAVGPLDDHASWAGVGRAAARLLTRRLTESDRLGFTWGPETVAVARALPTGAAACRAIVQLDGAMTTGDYQSGSEYVLGRCAEQLQAEPIRLPAPLYADAATVSSLRSDSMFSVALEAGRTAAAMMFGVGPVSTSTTLFEGSYLDTAMLDTLTRQGAVGEIGGRFFAADGTILATEMSDRTVSVALEDIRACPKSLLVTGGAAKHEAALGALRGGFARLLICDIDCARWLLEQQ
ncbi:sugar-binding transcriptional regulator [Nocardia sp. BMG51109]|uniref:sugar-binding transcriptional regulator n=1 Tax=Nocardia sp. BMG51109 TaxID=1056816 RepID=UPI0004641E93|nr:sugar-binding domain-containing protein [Nocardia sp. BMG51109]